MSLVRWLILLLNVLVIAGIVLMWMFFNLTDYHVPPPRPYSFRPAKYVEKDIKPRVEKKKSYRDIGDSMKIPRVIVVPDCETVVDDDPGTADLKKLKRLVQIFAVVYNPENPELSGVFVKIGREQLYYMVREKLTYGTRNEREPIKEYDYWLHAIKEVHAGKEYQVVFRNKAGKTLPLSYMVKPIKDIRIR